MTALLKFDRITVYRGARLLFEDLDLEVAPGESLHVSGPNGSGKSSLIRIAAGLLQPVRGTVERSACALADDNSALDRELPLRQALCFWVASPDEALTTLDLWALRNVPVRLLSSGQRKRATLARVLGSRAPLWLLDEPLNALDDVSAATLINVIREHVSGGGAVVTASHQPLSGTWRKLELGR